LKILDRLFKREEVIEGEIPKHVAIIMDGNGRWAKQRGMPRMVGHREGAKRLKKVVSYLSKIGVKYCTVYAFSTENWRRPKKEVDGLMKLLLDFLKNAEIELGADKVKIDVIGDTASMPDEIQKQIVRVVRLTEKNDKINLIIALNYGGRNEVVNAVKKISKKALSGEIDIENIDEKLISENMYYPEVPDPDLIIRTSGEKRTSNFLLWQSVYSEYLFVDTFWPDFNEEKLQDAINDYKKRKRRYGGI
jgi:undecaprenyl diphosphate synthase